MLHAELMAALVAGRRRDLEDKAKRWRLYRAVAHRPSPPAPLLPASISRPVRTQPLRSLAT